MKILNFSARAILISCLEVPTNPSTIYLFVFLSICHLQIKPLGSDNRGTSLTMETNNASIQCIFTSDVFFSRVFATL